MTKVCIVLCKGIDSRNPILGVYSPESKAQAEASAETWMNECAGRNVYSGLSIGRRRDYQARAWVETHEVQEP
jgi:hypothetical protein